MTKLAIIRIRGQIGLSKPVRDTFKMLRLYKKNNCVIVEASPTYFGMIQRLKDFITWGEIDQETVKLLIKERARLPGNKKLTEDYLKEKLRTDLDTFVKEFLESKKSLRDIPGLKTFFRLKPPTKGFERKGTKLPFAQGGALGYRKEKINELIKRMI
ncbi:MAG: 50S ribosomal protein L30 [Candidatus Woesearchaeota archaeon]|nr:MAG: 50S ribosomal protein L30 [Candidatus Woesearchaeota archaeon]